MRQPYMFRDWWRKFLFYKYPKIEISCQSYVLNSSGTQVCDWNSSTIVLPPSLYVFELAGDKHLATEGVHCTKVHPGLLQIP